MADIGWVVGRVDALKQRHAPHMNHVAEVSAIRRGDWSDVAGDFFSNEVQRPVVSNQIDALARHAQAALSNLPTISCQTSTSSNDAARKRADKRTKIAASYVKRSRLQAQMQQGADQFYTYGVIVASVEPMDDGVTIFIEDSGTVYPVWDRLGRTKAVAHVFRKPLVDVIAQFPEHEAALDRYKKVGRRVAAFNGDIEITKYVDDDWVVLYASAPSGSAAGSVVLINEKNPIGKCTSVAVKRPSLDGEIRGAFDDLIFVQLAKHLMQTYLLSAVEQAVNAPFAAPDDVHELVFGPNEVIRSADPAGIRRIAAEVPQSAWASVDYLEKEINSGAISPEALNGSIDASVVTGKGVQQLMAGYSQQIAMAQETLVGFYEQVLCLAFEVDQKAYAGTKRTIDGTHEGQSYKVDYDPAVDIDGDYSINVAFGGIAGLDPNRGLVLILQARGDGLVSRDYARRHLPVSDMDPQDEETKVAVENLRDSLIQGLSTLPQLMPQVMASGGDPLEFIRNTADAIDQIQKNQPIEEVVRKVFAPKPPPETPPAPTPNPADAAAGGAGGQISPDQAGIDPNAGLASRGPNAKQDLQTLFAGMSASGAPNLSGGVSRMLPAG